MLNRDFMYSHGEPFQFPKFRVFKFGEKCLGF